MGLERGGVRPRVLGERLAERDAGRVGAQQRVGLRVGDEQAEGVGADRFLPIPPRRIEVREGETEVIVELQRK